MESICCRAPTQSGIVMAQKKDFCMKNAFNRMMLFTSMVALPFTFKGGEAAARENPDPTPRTEFATNFGDVAADPGDGGKNDPIDSVGRDDKAKATVKVKDLRKYSFDEAYSWAAKHSDKGVVFFYAGNDQEKVDRFIKVGNDLVGNGFKIIGVVQCRKDSRFANGQEGYSTIIAGGAFGDVYTDFSEAKIREEGEDAYNAEGHRLIVRTADHSSGQPIVSK